MRRARILLCILVRAIEQPRADRIAVIHRAWDQRQLARMVPLRDLLRGISGKDSDLRAGFHQQAQLCQCRITATRDDNARGLRGYENRKVVHGVASSAA